MLRDRLASLASSLWLVGIPLMGVGCAQTTWTKTEVVEAPAEVTTKVVAQAAGAGTPIQVVQHTEPAGELPKVTSREVPINLDTVLRLAEGQNVQIALARSRVEEAYATKGLAQMSWLPSLNAGVSFLRHEGGIANEDGTLTRSSFGTLFGGVEINSRLDLRDVVFQRVNAERLLWQQKGDLRRVTTETLLDATNTYLDILAARTGEAVAESLQKELEDLHARAKKRAAVEKGSQVEVFRIEAGMRGREQAMLKLREQADRSLAKLAYLLGLEPCVHLVPIDEKIVPFELVDATPSVCDLVAQALAHGPGVREMEGLLSLIAESMEKAAGPGKYLPVLEMRVAEGGFGTGPGDSLTWDNRLDVGLQARWNLMEHFTRCERDRILRAKTAQAHLAYQDLRGKLTAGVQEAREAILSGKEQIRLGEKQIEAAQNSLRLSKERLRENLPDATGSEVLLQLQAVAVAQADYLNAIRSYDQAQLRLMILLGTVGNQEKGSGTFSCAPCPQKGN